MRKLLFASLVSVTVFGCGGGGGSSTSAGGGSTDTGGKTSGTSSGAAGAQGGSGGASSAGATSTGGAGTGGTTGGASTRDSDCVPLPGKSRTYDHILNLVDPDITKALTEYLQQPIVTPDGKDPLDLGYPSRAFYELYPDQYDFLVFLSAKDVSDTIEGLHSSVNSPLIPGTGVKRTYGSEYGSAGRLLSAIGMDFRDFQTRPPFAHEVAHHWGVYLDKSLGFGDKFEGGYASHWGTASVYGQLGGFDGATLRCKTPAGAVPPGCTAESDGRVQYVVGRFSPLSGTGLEVPYAPLELYLMGLVSAEEIPQTYKILTDAAPKPLKTDATTGDMTIDASGMKEVSIRDIIAKEGPRQLATQSERSFTMAVVLLTDTPASDQMLAAASRWAESFGGHAPDAPWPSFEKMTGGHARMETRLGRCRRVGEEDAPPPDQKGQCDVLLQNCAAGLACYDAQTSVCLPEGKVALGQPCKEHKDCAKGLECPDIGTTKLCAPYCDLKNASSPLACEKLCPGASVEVWSSSSMAAVGAFCTPGSGGGTCDPLAQTCGAGLGCYGREATTCQVAGKLAMGATCAPMGGVCVPGAECIGRQGGQDYCQPFCNPTGSDAKSCAKLCPGGAWNYGAYSICIPSK